MRVGLAAGVEPWQKRYASKGAIRKIFRIRNECPGSLGGVPASLERQLGKFLRGQRGEMTYAQFSRKLGLPPSTLHRLESGDQSITLRGLQQIMRRLKCRLVEIFPDQFRF